MNSLPTILAACVLALVVTAPPAVAGPRVSLGECRLVVTGRASCGCPNHSFQVCTGFDRGQRPVYTSYRQPFVCSCDWRGDHSGAVRNFHKRRATEYRNNQQRLEKVHVNYEKDLEKAYDRHRRKVSDIERDRYRDPRKFRDRRAEAEHDHRERLRKIEDDYRKDLDQARDKHQRELDEHYRDLLRGLR